jgi:hypothetical protein
VETKSKYLEKKISKRNLGIENGYGVTNANE